MVTDDQNNRALHSLLNSVQTLFKLQLRYSNFNCVIQTSIASFKLQLRHSNFIQTRLTFLKSLVANLQKFFIGQSIEILLIYIMSRKSDIITLLVAELKKIQSIDTDTRRSVPYVPYTYKSSVNDRVYPKFKFIDEVNDWPTICLIIGNEGRTYIGAGIKYGTLDVTIRGYVQSENALDTADDLLEDIEHTVNSLSHLPDFCQVGLVEARIESVSTDDGLFEPMGVVDVKALLIYEYSEALTTWKGVFSNEFTGEFS